MAALGCAHLSLLDNSEFGLFRIDNEIVYRFPTLSRSAVLCDIRDEGTVDAALVRERPDLIFHAAALKHIPMVENHACEGVLTNVLGTRNVALAARRRAVRHMVLISTDKAVSPSNLMGATKRLAENYVRGFTNGGGGTHFAIVRFGNVLGSTGSVVPLFQDQIARGGPVTVTHPDVERFFMTIAEAVQLVLRAAALGAASGQASADVFVLEMGKPVRIMDLARQMIELNGLKPGRDIRIEITGLRPGEKLTEELVDADEAVCPSADPAIMRVVPRGRAPVLSEAELDELARIAHRGDNVAARRRVFDLVRSQAALVAAE